MNAQSVKLLDILSECQPENEELAKISMMAVIEQMPEYQELAHRKDFKKEFDQFLTKEKLESFTIDQLKNIQMAIPSIPDCLDNIMYSLKNGNCPLLKLTDRPDFMNKASLDVLSAKLEDGSGKNYTNISPDEFMKIFDDTTVKSLRKYFDAMPHHCADYGIALQKLFGETKYCISEAELKELDREYSDKVDDLNRIIGAGKFIRFKQRVIKAFLGLFFIAFPAIIASATGCLDTDMEYMTMLIMFIAVLVYWVKG